MRQDKLQKTRAAKLRIQAQIRQLIAKEVELILDDELKQNTDYTKACKDADKLKKRLHKVRVNIARKGFSMKSHARHVERLEATINDYRTEEQQKASALEATKLQMKIIENAQRDQMISRHSHTEVMDPEDQQ